MLLLQYQIPPSSFSCLSPSYTPSLRSPLLYAIPGAEALAAQMRLATLLSYKLKREYSEMCGFVRARMSLSIVRSNSLLIRGPHDKGARIWQQPELTDGAVRSLLTP